MAKSIIPNNDEYCYLCKRIGIYTKATDEHHLVFGTANRKISDREGLTINLCHTHHMRLHQHGEYKEELQQLAEKTWLEHNNKTIEDWLKIFDKNYL